MEQIAGAVRELMERLGLSRDSQHWRIVGCWSELVGPELARRSQALRVQRGTLWVEVSAPVWGQQLTWHKYQLLSRIAARFGPGVVQDIRTVVAQESLTAPAGGGGLSSPGEAPPAVDAQHWQEAEQLTAGMADEELRHRLQGVVARALARRDNYRAQGWPACRRCGLPHRSPGGELCFICRDQEQARRGEYLQLMLMQVPWYTYQEASAELPGLTEEEYRAVKEVIAARWESAASRLRRAHSPGESGLKHLLEMLHKGVRPEDLTPPGVEKSKRGNRC